MKPCLTPPDGESMTQLTTLMTHSLQTVPLKTSSRQGPSLSCSSQSNGHVSQLKYPESEVRGRFFALHWLMWPALTISLCQQQSHIHQGTRLTLQQISSSILLNEMWQASRMLAPLRACPHLWPYCFHLTNAECPSKLYLTWWNNQSIDMTRSEGQNFAGVWAGL